MTLNEFVYNIKNIAKGGLTSSDASISDRNIAHWISTERAYLIKKDMEVNRYINSSYIQSLGCVQIECLDKAQCCQDSELQSYEYIHRTVKEIPKPLVNVLTEAINSNLFTYVGLITYDTPFEFTSTPISNWSKYRKFTKNSIRAFYRDNHIYIDGIKNPMQLEYIGISGIFEDPTKVAEFTTCTKEPCFTFDREYPFPSHLTSVLYTTIIEKYLNFILQTNVLQDTTNDAKDNKKNN